MKSKLVTNVEGRVRLTVRSVRTGRVLKKTPWMPNLFTTAGKTHLLKLLIGESDDIAQYCGVGSGTTAVNVADTAVETELGRVSLTSYSRSGLVATLTYFFAGADCNGTWGNEGLLTASSGGTLCAHCLVSPTITKTTSKTVTLEHELTFS